MFLKQNKIILLLLILFPQIVLGQDSIPNERSVAGDSIENKPVKETVSSEDLPRFNKSNWKSFENEEERIEFYKKWVSADSAKIEEKMRLKPKKRIMLSKVYKNLNFFEKFKYRLAYTKVQRKRRKHFKSQKRKFKKTISWSKPGVGDKVLKNSDREAKIKYYKAQNVWLSRKEEYRKMKIKERFARKEIRLEKRYALTVEEKTMINKSLVMRMKPEERAIVARGRKKQVTYTRKLNKLRKRRHLKYQDKPTERKLKRQKKQLSRKKQRHARKQLKKRPQAKKQSLFGRLFRK